jgi:hypothetical protein
VVHDNDQSGSGYLHLFNPSSQLLLNILSLGVVIIIEQTLKMMIIVLGMEIQHQQ